MEIPYLRIADPSLNKLFLTKVQSSQDSWLASGWLVPWMCNVCPQWQGVETVLGKEIDKWPFIRALTCLNSWVTVDFTLLFGAWGFLIYSYWLLDLNRCLMEPAQVGAGMGVDLFHYLVREFWFPHGACTQLSVILSVQLCIFIPMFSSRNTLSFMAVPLLYSNTSYMSK